MDPDSLVIRSARPDEAETLSHMIFRAKACCEYPRELMDLWLGEGRMTVTQDDIEANPTYVAEDEEEGEVIGFCSVEAAPGECRLKNLHVLPEYVGAGIRTALFLHACELAETSGAESLSIEADEQTGGFFEELGAVEVSRRVERYPNCEAVMVEMRLML